MNDLRHNFEDSDVRKWQQEARRQAEAGESFAPPLQHEEAETLQRMYLVDSVNLIAASSYSTRKARIERMRGNDAAN